MSAEALEETLRRWAAEAADTEADDTRRRLIREWAAGAAIALTYLGHDDLVSIADDIWNPRREK